MIKRNFAFLFMLCASLGAIFRLCASECPKKILFPRIQSLEIIHRDDIEREERHERKALPQNIDEFLINQRTDLLLERYGRNIDGGEYESTPLIEAIRDMDVGVVKELLRRGANINQPDKEGTTALDAAIMMASWRGEDQKSADDEKNRLFRNARAIVHLLIRAGAECPVPSD